jgi:hypothetical protein
VAGSRPDWPVAAAQPRAHACAAGLQLVRRGLHTAQVAGS